jgi:hypothetical protein
MKNKIRKNLPLRPFTVTRSTAVSSTFIFVLLLLLLLFVVVEETDVIGCRGIDISFFAGLAIIMDSRY